MRDIQDTINTVSDGDMLREMTRHNAADFVEAIVVLVKAARNYANPDWESIYEAANAVRVDPTSHVANWKTKVARAAVNVALGITEDSALEKNDHTG